MSMSLEDVEETLKHSEIVMVGVSLAALLLGGALFWFALVRRFRRPMREQQGLIQPERFISMGKLAAGVAHEINNPLTGILSYAEDLMEDADG